MGDLDLQSLAMIGGLFIAGFTAVWIYLGLRQSEKPRSRPQDGDRT